MPILHHFFRQRRCQYQCPSRTPLAAFNSLHTLNSQMLWNATKRDWYVTDCPSFTTEMAAPDRTTINSFWITFWWIRLLKYLIVMHQPSCFLTQLRPHKLWVILALKKELTFWRKIISISLLFFSPTVFSPQGNDFQHADEYLLMRLNYHIFKQRG